MIEVSLSNATATEDYSSTLSFVVTLSEPALDVVTMAYRAIPNGTASDLDIDYAFGTSRNVGTVTFAPGQTTATIQIAVDSDTLDEKDESIVMELNNLSSNAVFQGGNLVLRNFGIIQDNDGTGPDLAVFVGDPIVVEGDSGQREAVFDIMLSRPADSAFTLQYSTADLDATAGSDYVAANGSLNILPGQSTAQVRIPILGDTFAEGNERFALIVTPPSSPIIDAAGAVGYAMIKDDDSGTGPVVSIESAPVDESYYGYVRFDVKLSQPPIDSVSMSYRTFTNQNAQNSDIDYQSTSSTNNGTVVFAPGQTSASFYVAIDSDTLDERDEAFTVELYGLSENASFPQSQLSLLTQGIILDDDGLGPNLALFVADPVVVEGDSGAQDVTFELQLSRPATTAFSVNYSTANITATAGSDYVAKSGTINFAVGQDRAAVTVRVNGDAVSEQTETFALNITGPTNILLSTEGLSGVATLMDNDSGSGPVISMVRAVSTEEAYYGNIQYVVSLSEASLQTVTVNYATSFGSAQDADLSYTASSTRNNGTLTFAPGQTSGSIYIQATSDTVDERDESVFMTLSQPTNAVLAGGEPTITGVGFVLDNDGVGLNIALAGTPISFQEPSSGSRLVEVPVFLSQAPGQSLTFDVTASGVNAVAGSDFALVDRTVTFAAGQTEASVTVRVYTDLVNEGLESFKLNYAAQAGSSFAGTVLDQTVTIRNYAVPTQGDDRVIGTDAAELFDGLGGNDFIIGAGGNDTLRGGDGADTIDAGLGDDFIYGGASSADLRDVIYGGEGNDYIDGGYGNDELRGDAGNDTVSGGFGADTVIGGDGDDVLTGAAFGDVIFGSNGDDFINGGFGFDRVNGGTGADKFYHLGVRDHGSDWIQDYNSAEGDVLMFGGPASTQASDFLVQRASTANAGLAGVQEIFVTQKSTGNLLWALVDGDAQAQINIQIGAQVFDLLA